MSGLAPILPDTLPVFAIGGALLLPGARLPLTVFEPRYLALVDDALGQGRMFALVQPRADERLGVAPGLRDVGCAARIVAFGETGDGRYLITALGVSRFRVKAEAAGKDGYRRVVADYSGFESDGAPDDTRIDRHRLVNAVGAYLVRRGVSADLGRMDDATDSEVVTALAMAAPLSADEKQTLLEAAGTAQRAKLMTEMFELALLTDDNDANMPLH